MTLSNEKLQRKIAKRFVCTWGNVDGDPNAGASYAHRPKDPPSSCIRGNGEHNMQILVLTPEGELLNAMAGYLAPAALDEELGLALEIWRDLEKIDRKTRGQGRSRELRQALVRERHERFLRDFGTRALEGVFADFIRRRVVSDHRYAARNALSDARSFRPEAMVGNAKTFFGGYRGGEKPGRIGDGAPRTPRKR